MEKAKVTSKPDCDVCGMVGVVRQAQYDAKTKMGWGYLCEDHFRYLGAVLGTGKGQRLILEGENQ